MQVILTLLDLLIFPTGISPFCLFKLQLSEQNEKNLLLLSDWRRPGEPSSCKNSAPEGNAGQLHSLQINTWHLLSCLAGKQSCCTWRDPHSPVIPHSRPPFLLWFLTWYCFYEERLVGSICRFPEWVQPSKFSPGPLSLQFHRLQGEKFTEVGLVW